MVTKVISGGQTGVDQIGLEVAYGLGITTGGTAPRGYITESGPNLMLADKYHLDECEEGGYTKRTEINVIESDGTVLFGDMTSPGSRQTINFCIKHNKYHITNPTVEELKSFILQYRIKDLNVAGNRASKMSGSQMNAYRNILTEALTTIKSI